MDGCSKCPLVIPGGRYRPQGGVILSPPRSEQNPASKTSTELKQLYLPSIRQAPAESDLLSRAKRTPA